MQSWGSRPYSSIQDDWQDIDGLYTTITLLYNTTNLFITKQNSKAIEHQWPYDPK